VWSCTSAPITPSWPDTQLKHLDDFTFTLQSFFFRFPFIFPSSFLTLTQIMMIWIELASDNVQWKTFLVMVSLSSFPFLARS
jgi:hypothetical protein